MAKTKEKENGHDEFAAYRESVQRFFTVDQRLAKAVAKVADLKAKLSEALQDVESIKEEKSTLAEKLGLDAGGESKKTGKPGGGTIRDAVVEWFKTNAEDWTKFPMEQQKEIASYPSVQSHIRALVEAGSVEKKGGGKHTQYIWKG